MKLLLPAALLLTLTACSTVPIEKTVAPPGNEVAMLITQPDFRVVATSHPVFTAYVLNTIARLELEQAQSKARMFSEMKTRRRYVAKKIPPPVPSSRIKVSQE